MVPRRQAADTFGCGCFASVGPLAQTTLFVFGMLTSLTSQSCDAYRADYKLGAQIVFSGCFLWMIAAHNTLRGPVGSACSRGAPPYFWPTDLKRIPTPQLCVAGATFSHHAFNLSNNGSPHDDLASILSHRMMAFSGIQGPAKGTPDAPPLLLRPNFVLDFV